IYNNRRSLLYFARRGDTFNLETIDLDATNHRILATGFEDVSLVISWMQDPFRGVESENDYPDFIAISGKRQGKRTAELVNPKTGQHLVLANRLAAIDGFGPDIAISGVKFYWQDVNGDDGVDGYNLDGKRIYHLKFPDHLFPGSYQE